MWSATEDEKGARMLNALTVVQKFFPHVTKVVDGTGDKIVEVTSKDAGAAKVKSHDHCAMALACKRSLHLDGAIIALSTAYLVKGKTAKRYRVPPGLRQEIVSFDRGAGFGTGQYRLSEIPHYEKLGARQKRKGGKLGGANKTASGGLKKRFYQTTKGVRDIFHERPGV